MRRFGTDKPDLRMGLELVECTDYFKDTPFRVFQAPYVGAVVMPGGADQPRKQLDAWQEWAKQRGARGLAYVLVGADGELGGPVAKNLSETERPDSPSTWAQARRRGVLRRRPRQALARPARRRAARDRRRVGLIDESAWKFVWIVDAPLFEPTDEATAAGDVAVGSGAWTAVHHAFTAPKPECLDTFDVDPSEALAYAYDIVCNGNEIGGGSIRIHREDVQKRVFATMGIGEAEAEEKFGFLLEAFKYGAPPHGGIAFGWDRICALLSGTDSIRDVIAFPKTGAGYDPLTAAWRRSPRHSGPRQASTPLSKDAKGVRSTKDEVGESSRAEALSPRHAKARHAGNRSPRPPRHGAPRLSGPASRGASRTCRTPCSLSERRGVGRYQIVICHAPG